MKIICEIISKAEAERRNIFSRTEYYLVCGKFIITCFDKNDQLYDQLVDAQLSPCIRCAAQYIEADLVEGTVLCQECGLKVFLNGEDIINEWNNLRRE